MPAVPVKKSTATHAAVETEGGGAMPPKPSLPPSGKKSTAARKDVPRLAEDGTTTASGAATQQWAKYGAEAGTQALPVDTHLPATTEGSGSTGGTDVGGGGESEAREGAPADEAEPAQVEAPVDTLVKAEAAAAHLAPRKRGRPSTIADMKAYKAQKERERRAKLKGEK